MQNIRAFTAFKLELIIFPIHSTLSFYSNRRRLSLKMFQLISGIVISFYHVACCIEYKLSLQHYVVIIVIFTTVEKILFPIKTIMCILNKHVWRWPTPYICSQGMMVLVFISNNRHYSEI